jgi:hypothetical protein
VCRQPDCHPVAPHHAPQQREARRLASQPPGERLAHRAHRQSSRISTSATLDAASVRAALRAAAHLYLDLRDDAPPTAPAPGMPSALLALLDPP